MPSEWRKVSLRDIVDIYDGPHATPKKTDEGAYFLGISNLQDGRIDLSAPEFLSEDDFERWTRRVTPSADDLVFSYETRLGQAALIPSGFRGCLGRRMGLMRVRDNLVNKRFLLYAYLGPQFQETIRARTVHGSTVDRIPLIEMPDFPIALPDRPTQDSVASVLGALDDKIELNGSLSATLEAIARALFKSWFVDFDPVRAKAEGRDPYVPAEIAALFPDKFETTARGELPVGWNLVSLREAAEVLSGGTPAKDNPAFWGGSIPWISPKAMTGIHVSDSNDRVTPQAIGRGTRLAKAGSVLVMVRGMGLHQGTRISQARADVTFNQDVKALIPKKLSGTHLLYGMLEVAPYLFSKVQASGHGTGTLPTDILESIDFAVPRDPDCASLLQSLSALNDRIAAANSESTTLALLRDALLPKLISGELRVTAAERILDKSA